MTKVSFEFFPPREAASMDSLVGAVLPKLTPASPEFFSVTYGAGGSTRDGTVETVRRLIAQGVDAVPHLSIGGDDKLTISALLQQYQNMGVKRIVALRGDLPSGTGRARFTANAQTLVGWIRETLADTVRVAVAAYPEVHPDASSPDQDFEFFAAKVRAGADEAITQYFYNPYAYYDFIERCERAGLNIPVYVGVMPITNVASITRFSNACGADIPRWMAKRLEALGDNDTAVRDFAVDAISRICDDLRRNGAPGFHFYTLNRWGATRRILDNLGL